MTAKKNSISVDITQDPALGYLRGAEIDTMLKMQSDGLIKEKIILNEVTEVKQVFINNPVVGSGDGNLATSIDGANVIGAVATATHANVADTANSISASGIVGTVANATYAAQAGAVGVANVVGIGNIATINKDGSNSNVLYGNGVFASLPVNNYGNSNVASYLPTYSGDLSPSNVHVTTNTLLGDHNTPSAYHIYRDTNQVTLGSTAADMISINSYGISIGGTGGVNIQGAANADITIGSGGTGNVKFPKGIMFNDGSTQTTAAQAFNQSLNTTNEVTFANVKISSNGGFISSYANTEAGLEIYGEAQRATLIGRNTQYDIYGKVVTSGTAGNVQVSAKSGSTSSMWLFDYDGALYFPDGTIQYTAYTGTSTYGDSNVASLLSAFGSNSITTTGNLYVKNVYANSHGNLKFGDASATGNPGMSSTTTFSIVTNRNTAEKQWVFNNDGSLMFPDGSYQTTAYTGSAYNQDLNTTDNVEFSSVTTSNINLPLATPLTVTFNHNPSAAPSMSNGSNGHVTISPVIVQSNLASFHFKTGNYHGLTVYETDNEIRMGNEGSSQIGIFKYGPSTQDGKDGDFEIGTSRWANPHGGNLWLSTSLGDYKWKFGKNGDLYVPGNIRYDGASPSPSLTGFSTIEVADVSAGANITAGGNLLVSGEANVVGNLTIAGAIRNADDANTIIRTKTTSVAPGGEHTYDFIFDTSGSLNFKYDSTNSMSINRFGITADTQMTLSAANSVSGNNSSILFDKDGGGIVLRLETNAPLSKTWCFYQGNVTFPDGSVQTTAYTGGGSYGNSNVATLLASFGSNTITTTGNVSVGNIIATNIGNISSINKDGNASNVLLGNGTFASAGSLRTQLVADTTFALSQGSTHSLTSAMYRVVFTGGASSTSSTVVLPDTSTCYIGQSFVLVSPTQNYNYTIQLYGGVSSGKTWTAGMTVVATVVAQRVAPAAEVASNWSYSWQGAYSVTGSGPTVLTNSPTISAPLFTGNVDTSQSGVFLGQTAEKYSTWGYAVNTTTTAVPTAVAAGGVFTIPNTQGLGVGQTVTITGTNSGTGSISGYTSGTTYYIINNTLAGGVTSITLATARNSSTTVTTTAGTLTGLTMTFGAQVSVNVYGSSTNNGSIVNVTGTIGSNFDLSILGQINTSYAMSVTIIINQGATPYMLGNVYLGTVNNYYVGTAQTISWQGGSAPTGTANKKDVITLSWLPSSATTAAVMFGQLVSFG